MTDGGTPADPTIAISRNAEARRLALFLGVGLVGLGIDVAVFSGLHGAGLSRATARAVSLVCATGATWSLNRSFTFAASGRRAHDEVIRYVAVTLGAQGVSYGLFLGLSAEAPALPATAALLAGAACATLLSFTGQRLFTFRGA